MTPFHPLSASTVSISATTTSANVALVKQPNQGPFQIRIHNAGASTVFVTRGVDSSATATVPSGGTPGSFPVPSGAVEVITVNSPEAAPTTYMAAITSSGTATVYFTPGAGY